MALDASGNLTSLSDTGYTRSDLVSFFNGLASKYGVSVEPGDVDLLAAKLMGESGCIRQLGGDPQRCFDSFESQYARRGGPVGQGDTENVGSFKVSGSTTRDEGERSSAAATATTVAAPAATAPPTVGPTGLANPNAPINYATGAIGPQYGYGGVGGIGATAPAGGSNMMMWLLLGGAALAVFFLMRK